MRKLRPRKGRDLSRVTQRVRGRSQHFYFSNKGRNFKNKLPVTSGSPEVPDKGAGVMETGPMFMPRFLLSRSISLPPALLVPTVLQLCSHCLQLMAEGNIPNPDARERKQTPQTR